MFNKEILVDTKRILLKYLYYFCIERNVYDSFMLNAI